MNDQDLEEWIQQNSDEFIEEHLVDSVRRNGARKLRDYLIRELKGVQS